MKASIEDGFICLNNATAVDGIPTKGSRYTKRQSGTVSFNTVLYPVRPGETAQISTENIELDVDPSVANAFCAKEITKTIGIEKMTDAAITCAQFALPVAEKKRCIPSDKVYKSGFDCK